MNMAPGAGPWSLYVSLQRRCLQAADKAALGFLVANETWHLVPYQQASVWLFDSLGRPQLQTVSGLVNVQESTPFTQWLQRLVKHRWGTVDVSAPQALVFAAEDLPADLATSWHEWWSPHGLMLPLVIRGQAVGAVLLNRDSAWKSSEIQMLQLLQEQFAYCFHALARVRPTLGDRWRRLKQRPRRLWLVLGAVAIVSLLPVRTSVLAPAEVVALQAEAITAPADGVVKAFHVTPNQTVRAGELLLTLDDTTLRNRYEVAAQGMAVARTDALSAQQRAFDHDPSRAELAGLQGRIRERAAELAYLQESLKRLEVRASHDGLFAYSDPNDWLGKPVATGERLGLLAQPDVLGVTIWLPVPDAINLEVGADIRVYLQTRPLDALTATLEQTSYQATLSPNGVASYRVRGRLIDGDKAHIGLRGVAKVYGDRMPVAYWVMRRPVGALRQWVGM